MTRFFATIHRRIQFVWLAVFFWLVFAIITGPIALADISRPTEGSIRINVRIFVIDVDEIDSANQRFSANVFLTYRWKDSRLAHSGTKPVSRSLHEVWNPQIQFVNQQKVWPTFPKIVEIDPQGNVTYSQRVWGDFSQPLNLRAFPFDRQVFSIQLAAAGYTPEEIELVPASDHISGIAQELSVLVRPI